MQDGVLPVDVAMMLFGTMQHLHTVEDVNLCWSRIHRSLKPGGVLLLELPHFDDIFNSAIMEPQFWEMSMGGHHSVVVEFGTEDDQFDAETQVPQSYPALKHIDYSTHPFSPFQNSPLWMEPHSPPILIVADVMGFHDSSLNNA